MNKNLKLIQILVNSLLSIILLYGMTLQIIKISSVNLEDTNTLIKILLVISLIVILIHVSVILHEVGHMVGSFLVGIKIIIINCGPLKIIRNNKFNIKFDFKKIFEFNGFVLQEINYYITSEDKMLEFYKKYILFLWSGIITTIGILIITSTFILLNKFVTISILLLIINMIILNDSFNNNELKYGDIYLINLLKNNQEYIDSIFINNVSVEYPLNKYFELRVEAYLANNIKNENYNILNLGLADKILDYYIIRNKKLSCELEKLQNKCFLNFMNNINSDVIEQLVIIKLAYKFLLHKIVRKDNIKYIDYLDGLNNFIDRSIKVKDFYIVSNIKEVLNKTTNNLVTKTDIVKTIDDYIFFTGCCSYDNKVDKYSEKLLEIIDNSK